MKTKMLESRLTLRLKDEEKEKIEMDAKIAGLTSSEIIRRRFFGQPIIAHADLVMVRELRRIGGLLKNNFETMRQANMSHELLSLQETALQNLNRAIEALGEKTSGRQKGQK